MTKKTWKIHQPDPQLQGDISKALEIQILTSAVLVNRGIKTLDEARGFFDPGLEGLIDPFRLPDMEKAVSRILKALKLKEQVAIFGDFDVDGITATSIFYEWFRRQDCPVIYYIPHRVNEGYGFSETAVRLLYSKGVKLIITADCGTTSIQEIQTARSLGMDVIVTDHHEVPPSSEVWPEGSYLVNPKRSDSEYGYTGLCTAGLSYKVTQAASMKMNGSLNHNNAFDELDLVALGTLADVSPMLGENRFLVKEGLKQLSEALRPGIRALKETAGLDGQEVGCGAVGFRLAPRINAIGRLSDAADGVRLFTTRSRTEAQQIATALERWNQKRQEIERDILEDVDQKIENEVDLEKDLCIVLSSNRWHVGVIGIVASRIVDRYHRPAILIALDGTGIGRGSARSIPEFHLQRGFSACSDLLLRFGGHRQAAGLAIAESLIPEFQKRLNAQIMEEIDPLRLQPRLNIDAVVDFQEIKVPLISEFERLRPHGIQNPEPTLVARNTLAVSSRIVGKNHLKMKVRNRGGLSFDAIGFGMGDRLNQVRSGQPIDLAFTPEMNTWQGNQSIQLRIKDIQMGHMS